MTHFTLVPSAVRPAQVAWNHICARTGWCPVVDGWTVAWEYRGRWQPDGWDRRRRIRAKAVLVSSTAELVVRMRGWEVGDERHTTDEWRITGMSLSYDGWKRWFAYANPPHVLDLFYRESDLVELDQCGRVWRPQLLSA